MRLRSAELDGFLVRKRLLRDTEKGSSTEMRIPFIIALAVLAVGCPSDAVGPPPAPPVNWQSFDAGNPLPNADSGATSAPLPVAERYAAALASPAFADLSSLLDADAHFSFPGSADGVGRDAVVVAHTRLLGAFESRKVVADRIWRANGEQILEWELEGVQARDWMGIVASRQPVSVKGLALLSTKTDGAITDVHLYFDVAAMEVQLGDGPKALASAMRDAGAPSPAQLHVYEQGSSMSEPSNIAVARSAVDALENGNVAAYEAGLADDVLIYTPERPVPTRGKVEATASFRALRRAIGQLDTTITGAWSVGPYAVVEYTISGAQVAAIGWVPARRDKTIVMHVVDVSEIMNAKITRLWRYGNLAEIATSELP
jgi:hypothetical protein